MDPESTNINPEQVESHENKGVEDKLKKEFEAKERILAVLEETNCDVDIFLTIGTDKSIKGEWRILYKGQNE